MQLAEFQSEMESYRDAVDSEAKALKSPYLVLERMRSWYLSLDADQRHMANRVLAEWVLSSDATVRFDARALINDQRIVSAIPALRDLAIRLADASGPMALDELELVNNLLKKLSSS